jgi:ABC-type nitrate/sulfonate/bicarbonate transport system substrate-binding protein
MSAAQLMMRRCSFFAYGLALTLAASVPAGAQTAAPLRVVGFSGSSNWPIYIALDKGFFTRSGVEVTLSATPDSVTQLTGLIDGKIDIAMTAIDNVIAYQEGQGEVPTVQPDLVAFLGVNNGGRFNLMVGPGIKSYADLKGKDLAVDALTTGYAFLLREMVQVQGGLKANEYRLVSAGGSSQRADALQKNTVAGTLLNAPYDAIAERAGFRRLASATEVIGRYQGSVGATRRDWAAANQDKLVAYIRGYVAGVDWLYDPANKEEAKAILLKRLPRMKPEDAEFGYDELLSPTRGSLLPRAKIDIEGVRAAEKNAERSDALLRAKILRHGPALMRRDF